MDQVDSLNEIMSSALQSTPMADVGVSRSNVVSSAQVIAVAAELPSFQYFISEQAKSILALQELQNEVGALLEFRDIVMEAFPQLGQKVQNLQSQTTLSPSKWEPGIRVKRKLGQQLRDPDMLVPSLLPRYRSNSQGKASRSEISGSTTSSSAIQDSGFCTESSKDHSSALSSRSKSRETDDELSSLLDHIHHKGTRLKLEVEYLWSRLNRETSSPLSSTKRRCRSLDDLILTNNNAQSFTYEKNDFVESELSGLKRERDMLLKKMSDIESEHEAALANTSRLEEELENLSAEKRYLEERLQDAIHSEGRANDLQHNFLTRNHWRNVQTPFAKCQLLKLKQVFKKPDQGAEDGAAHAIPPSIAKDDYFRAPPEHAEYAAKISRPSNPVTKELNANSYQADSHKTIKDGTQASVVTLASTKEFSDYPKNVVSLGKPDVLIGFCSGHPSSSDSSKREGVTLSKEKVLSILNEYSTKELRCFLLTLSYQVEALNVQVQRISKSRLNIFKQLSKYKCENEDLRLELKKKEIELEGTKAQKRMLEQKRDIKLSYSTSDLMSSSPKSCDTRVDPAFTCSVSDSALMNERTSTPVSIRSGVKCTDLRDHSDKAMKSGGSCRRSISKIPLKTYSSKLPTKLHSNKKTLTSFKEYSALGPSHSSCISSTSSSLNK